LQDITIWLQQTVTESSPKTSEDFTSIEIPRGDYALQSLQIPKNRRVALSSSEKVRLLFAGKRNRPMFVLDENSILVLREKIEIYYNTNNLQDVSGVSVSSYVVGYCNNQRQMQINPSYVTNSSGWARARYGFFGNYYVSIVAGFPSIDYNFTVATQPLATSVVTYQLYSGNMTIHICGYLGESETQCGVV